VCEAQRETLDNTRADGTESLDMMGAGKRGATSDRSRSKLMGRARRTTMDGLGYRGDKIEAGRQLIAGNNIYKAGTSGLAYNLVA